MHTIEQGIQTIKAIDQQWFTYVNWHRQSDTQIAQCLIYQACLRERMVKCIQISVNTIIHQRQQIKGSLYLSSVSALKKLI